MGTRTLGAAALLLAATACKVATTGGPPGGNPPPDSGQTGATDAGSGNGFDAGPPGGIGCLIDGGVPTGFTNVVDAVVVPMIYENCLQVTPEDPGVLCRRMAIDLTGVTPTAAEMTGICTTAAPGQLADYFMNKTTNPNSPGVSPYAWVNRRFWADSFMYQPGTPGMTTYYHYVTDLDALVDQLYTGQITYDTFAKQALGSPAFARRFGIFDTNHDLVQLASQAFRVFLGREALPSEAEDFGNLWRGWSETYWTATQASPFYPDCTALNDGCRHYELGLQSSNCAGANALTCESTVLGPGAMIPPTSGFVAYAQFGAAEKQAVQIAGALLAARPEFAEAAVNRSLTKYLGWWKAGFYIPDYEVPAVRDALAKKLVAGGYDLRKMEREIVTSVLYTQKSSLQPGQIPGVPLWSVGPSKLMYAEAWLDSVGQGLGKQLGGCDFRYLTYPLNAASIQGAEKWPTSTGIAAGYYESQAQLLGGCPLAAAHQDATGILPAVTRRAVLAALCPGAFHAPAGTALTTLAQTQLAATGRAPSPAELNAVTSHLSTPADGSCDPNNLAACNLQGVSDNLCTALFASAAFTYY